MTDTSIGAVLRKGSAGWNALRKAGDVAADHTGATIENVSASRADLSNLQLVGTEWGDCELYGADFGGSDLSNAYFHGGRLEHCNFQGANLDGATFESIRLFRCDFSGADGLDALELDDVDLRDVVGLGGPRRESDGLVRLADKLPPDRHTLPLERWIESAKSHARVTTGRPASEDAIRGFETALGVKLPADYRAFLATIGHLEIEGDTNYGFGRLSVYGIGTMEAAVARYHEAFSEWGYAEGWLDAAPDASVDAKVLDEKRARLVDSLRLGADDVTQTSGDDLDPLRIAYRKMIPVIAVPDEIHRVVVTIGPTGRMYTVSIKERDVEQPSGTFTSRLLKAIDGVIVGAAG